MTDIKKDKEILNYVAPEGKLIAARSRKDLMEKRGWYNYLIERFSDVSNPSTDKKYYLREILYRLAYNIEIVPKCKVCGKPVVFRDKGFAEHCSKTCASNDPEVLARNKENVSIGMKKHHELKRLENDTK